MDWIPGALFQIFVCLPAGLFYAAVGIYLWTRHEDKKHDKRHKDDGK